MHFIADDQGAFTGALGMLFDASPLLGAPRSKVSSLLPAFPDVCSVRGCASANEGISQRYVAITEGDTITHLAVEPNPGEVTVTAADKILPWV